MRRTITLLPYIIVQNNNFSYDLEQPSGNQKLMLIFLFGEGKKFCSVEYTVVPFEQLFLVFLNNNSHDHHR
jgi:hypothetical protein